jgi:hypothetical protein
VTCFFNHYKVFTSLLCFKSDSSSLSVKSSLNSPSSPLCSKHWFRFQVLCPSVHVVPITLLALHKIAAAGREEIIFHDTRAFRKLISCTDPFSIIYILFFFLSSSVTIFFSFYPVPRPFRKLNWPNLYPELSFVPHIYLCQCLKVGKFIPLVNNPFQG